MAKTKSIIVKDSDPVKVFMMLLQDKFKLSSETINSLFEQTLNSKINEADISAKQTATKTKYALEQKMRCNAPKCTWEIKRGDAGLCGKPIVQPGQSYCLTHAKLVTTKRAQCRGLLKDGKKQCSRIICNKEFCYIHDPSLKIES